MTDRFRHNAICFLAGVGGSAIVGASIGWLLSVLLAPVTPEKLPRIEPVTPPRFSSQRQEESLYLVTDTKTGKKYLWAYRGSLIEVPD